MTSLHFLCVLVAGAVLGVVLAHPERPALLDPGMARKLFQLIEGEVHKNQSDGLNGTAAGQLTEAEVAELFSLFDVNGDGLVSRQEFRLKWVEKQLGDKESADFLFAHADTDQDGSISISPDLSRIYHYFDLNGDGKVSEMEFVVTWSSLSH